MDFKTIEEQRKVKERLTGTGNHIIVEEVGNKYLLLVLRDVLVMITDEDVLRAIKNQNQGIFDGRDEGDRRIEIKYRKARNPRTDHVVLCTSPKAWRKAVEAGALHIDLKRVKVAD